MIYYRILEGSRTLVSFLDIKHLMNFCIDTDVNEYQIVYCERGNIVNKLNVVWKH
jgi:hypothetical protein